MCFQRTSPRRAKGSSKASRTNAYRIGGLNSAGSKESYRPSVDNVYRIKTAYPSRETTLRLVAAMLVRARNGRPALRHQLCRPRATGARLNFTCSCAANSVDKSFRFNLFSGRSSCFQPKCQPLWLTDRREIPKAPHERVTRCPIRRNTLRIAAYARRFWSSCSIAIRARIAIGAAR